MQIGERKLNLWMALGVFVLAFLTYALTVAPTLSFWDCGEFIACAHILGIPHPPGTPLYMLLGRFFILAFVFVQEEALRMNYISVLSSAAMVAVAFLFTEKLIHLVFDGKVGRFVKYTGALTAAFLITFSDTVWFNAVEAEVYGLAMLFVMLISWLSLLWVEARGTPRGNRYLLLITYLGFLGVGFHLYTMMTFPAVFLLMLLVDKETRTNWPLIITGTLLMSIIYNIGEFMWFGIAAFAIAFLGWAASQNVGVKRKWSFSMWVAALALIGFSSHAYIPIRSTLDPRIDENNPEMNGLFDAKGYGRYKAFLERKQYGSDNMMSRAFHRRGQLGNQLLTHPHMGYGGYMLAQYSPWKVGELNVEDNPPVVRGGLKFPTQMDLIGNNKGLQFILFVLFQLPLFLGAWYAYKRNPAIGIYAFLLYAFSSFGLIFYMNFADGTQLELRDYQWWVENGKDPSSKPPPVHLEVRDRDYFFTPGFIFMGVLFGLALSMLLQSMQNGASALRRRTKGVGIAFLCLALVIPVFSNYKEHNRSGMYVPYDYAYNLLNSCRPNSVLFTNGDNDTFPLWFMQEVEGIRLDVRVVNLSLVNTDWYIHQLLTIEPTLKLGFSHAEIERLSPEANRFEEPRTAALGKTGLQVTMPSREQKSFFKVQDIMVINIVQNNYPERPIHFAVTVGDDNMMGLQKYVQMEGMVYTVTNEPMNKSVDAERTAYLVDSVYVFRGLGDNTTFIDNNTSGLLTNYSATNFRLVLWAQNRIKELQGEIAGMQQGLPAESDSAKAETDGALEALQSKLAEIQGFGRKYLELNQKLLPDDWRNHYYAGQYYSFIEEHEKAEKAYRKGYEEAPNPRMFGAQLAQYLAQRDKFGAAESVYLDLKQGYPDEFEFWYGLSDVYDKSGQLVKAKSVLEEWVQKNPNHQYTGMLRQQILNLEQRTQPLPELPAFDSSDEDSAGLETPSDGPEAPPGGIPAAPPTEDTTTGSESADDTGNEG